MQISKETFQFLVDLKKNNNRDWFKKNKKTYEAAKANFEEFIDALIGRISKFDPGVKDLKAKDCVFRIYRDIRFSKDKSPYKTHFGAHITPTTKKSEIHSRAGYYIHLAPGDSMLAGGAYLPESKWLTKIRAQIDQNASALKKVLNGKDFKEYFGEMEGEKLKTAPKGYPKDHPEIELLRHKSLLAHHSCPDKRVLGKDFLEHCSTVFKALKPFDDFLNGVA
jgi:uncharacterized protein (TIGR02453 family)